MTELAEKIDQVMTETAEVLADEPDLAPHRLWKIGKTTLLLGVDETGHGRTIVGGIDISHVVQKVEFDTGVGDVNHAKISVIGLPIELQALGVEITIDSSETVDGDAPTAPAEA